MDVVLTADECADAVRIGLARYDDGVRLNRKPSNKIERVGDTARRACVIGAVVEKAFAKRCGVPWRNAFIEGNLWYGGKKPDDFGGVEVRGTHWHGARETYLLVQKHAKDAPESVYVLGITTEGSMRVTFGGWQYGFEIKKPEFWDCPFAAGRKLDRPCFWYPRSKTNVIHRATWEWFKTLSTIMSPPYPPPPPEPAFLDVGDCFCCPDGKSRNNVECASWRRLNEGRKGTYAM